MSSRLRLDRDPFHDLRDAACDLSLVLCFKVVRKFFRIGAVVEHLFAMHFGKDKLCFL